MRTVFSRCHKIAHREKVTKHVNEQGVAVGAQVDVGPSGLCRRELQRAGVLRIAGDVPVCVRMYVAQAGLEDSIGAHAHAHAH